MKKITTVLFLLMAMGSMAQKKSGGKWIRLFNGKDLNDWQVKIKDHPLGENFANTFRVEDGAIKVSYDGYDSFKEQYGHIFYKKPFSSYLLRIQYRFTGQQAKDGPGWATRNSGAMLHCQSPESMQTDQDFPISLEAQFLGGNGKDERSTGNLCTPGTNVVLNNKLFTPHCVNSSSKTYHGDQWVQATILVLGDSIIHHIIEGDTVLTYTAPQYDGNDKWVRLAGLKGGDTIKEGYISLQAESHPVEFRTVELFDLAKSRNKPRKLQKVINRLREN